jgi:hypothetical protein
VVQPGVVGSFQPTLTRMVKQWVLGSPPTNPPTCNRVSPRVLPFAGASPSSSRSSGTASTRGERQQAGEDPNPVLVVAGLGTKKEEGGKSKEEGRGRGGEASVRHNCNDLRVRAVAPESTNSPAHGPPPAPRPERCDPDPTCADGVDALPVVVDSARRGARENGEATGGGCRRPPPAPAAADPAAAAAAIVGPSDCRGGSSGDGEGDGDDDDDDGGRRLPSHRRLSPLDVVDTSTGVASLWQAPPTKATPAAAEAAGPPPAASARFVVVVDDDSVAATHSSVCGFCRPCHR